MPTPENPTTARLLKANDVRGLGSKAVFNFQDLRQQGATYLDSVRQQAGQILEQTHAEISDLRRQGYQIGVEQGRKEGLHGAEASIREQADAIAQQTVAERLATTLPAMKAAALALVVERDRWLAAWESAAVRLAAAIAERLIRQRIALDPELTTQLVRQALEVAAGSPRVKLRLNPDDYASLGSHAAELVRTLSECGQPEIVPDGSVSRGGCLIETQHGVVDARIETMLERIVSELTAGTEG
jgi:flagellar assembly protein FliH